MKQNTNLKNKKNRLNPYSVTGFTDAEGTFSCYVKEGKKFTFEFKVVQKSYSSGVLYDILSYFGVGTVVIDNRGSDTLKYHVTSLESIVNIIIPHFKNYPCLTSKDLNFRDWAQIAIWVHNKEHLTEIGLAKIMALLNNMNTKRSFEDKFLSCNLNLNRDPFGITNTPLSPFWISSFVDGEGCFYAYITALEKLDNSKLACDLSLEIGQNSHDVSILLAFKNYFQGGYIKPKYDFTSLEQCLNSKSVNRYILRDTHLIINFFEMYPLMTRKKLDFLDWIQIVKLKEQNGLTKENLKLMWDIKNRMNSRRE